ncbi:MAG: folK [Collimonas fungivorans]|jgi:2-amino-4-hydroxy-6-hydroxymethyldihydropteridine diphosphokinase|uniref:2-amino-4-hydroxy-6- hydroxymethyldihydropteridine diphosphokinase n=1 Tax=Collimonas fungivorans TaxID=158899 RepID=UPI0026E9AE14|nr:2-amino-4-hydroxy-6-hydroxymethyldihydropteridine diphosphokinase [Collimonas fungivorans]MDB5767091.1 folK [Collimonas fungivorans]
MPATMASTVAHVAYIGLGANLGDARASVEQAIARLRQLPGAALLSHSALYRSAPFDAGGDDYINAVAALSTTLEPLPLLRALQAIEQEFGRERPYFHAPRTLDLDILLYGDQVIATPALTVPHPGLTQRAFALLPLLDIAPSILIPNAGPARQFAAAVGAQRIERLP